jgi:hypothetical protein
LKGWDGNRLVKSTVSRGTQEIKDRTVSICIATTGRRWPDLLKELSYVYTLFIAIVSRIYIAFRRVHFCALYDQLLSSNSANSRSKYSLSQLFFVIKLFGYRTFIWSRESFSVMQPRLLELKGNQPCELIPKTITFQTKQQMAMRRRSAEHVVRYACLLQMFANALTVLHSINEDTINFSNGELDEALECEAKNKVNIHVNNDLCVFFSINLHSR